MSALRYLTGAARFEVTSADIPGMLTAINDRQINISNIEQLDALRVCLTVSSANVQSLTDLLEQRGEQLKLQKRIGLFWRLRALLHRPVLILGFTMLLFAVLLLPTRVLFIEVVGNAQIPKNLILEKAELCGIRFGASRRLVRSERMKNALLDEIPQLQWAGINTDGCVAVISVKERTDAKDTQSVPIVSKLIADRDGVITHFTVWSGNSLCKVGQAVRQGQLLVSGFTDCGICVQANRAQGEVYALTNRDLTAITPTKTQLRVSRRDTKRKYSLIIGKNKIKFYNDSSILDSTCVKIYSDNYITLPGGFVLPVAVCREDWIYYDCEAAVVDETAAQRLLEDFTQQYLPAQMVAGEVLREEQSFLSQEDAYILQGKYACSEMIAREQIEETIVSYGEDS